MTDRIPDEREGLTLELKPETLDELIERIPEARSRQEAIIVCISNELERRRSKENDS